MWLYLWEIRAYSALPCFLDTVPRDAIQHIPGPSGQPNAGSWMFSSQLSLVLILLTSKGWKSKGTFMSGVELSSCIAAVRRGDHYASGLYLKKKYVIKYYSSYSYSWLKICPRTQNFLALIANTIFPNWAIRTTSQLSQFI